MGVARGKGFPEVGKVLALRSGGALRLLWLLRAQGDHRALRDPQNHAQGPKKIGLGYDLFLEMGREAPDATEGVNESQVLAMGVAHQAHPRLPPPRASVGGQGPHLDPVRQDGAYDRHPGALDGSPLDGRGLRSLAGDEQRGNQDADCEGAQHGEDHCSPSGVILPVLRRRLRLRRLPWTIPRRPPMIQTVDSEGLEKLRRAGRIASECREWARENIRPGVQVRHVLETVEHMIREQGA